MWTGKLILVVYLLQTTFAFYTLKQLSYTQLATSINRDVPVYGGLDLGTATDAAYDFVNNIVYVIGSTSHLMHVVDIADPSNPTVLFIHEFTKGEGVPMSIDICGDEIAVALAAQTRVNEGHVRFYKVYVKGSGATDFISDGYLSVGSNPNHLKYTKDCSTIIVANEGNSGKDEANAFVDPQGTVSIIQDQKYGNPSVRLVDFTKFNSELPDYNPDIRTPSFYIPPNVHSPIPSVAQEIEPEYIAISMDSRTAYVTLQENNGLAAIDINNGIVSKICPLGIKDWSSSGLDASDRDGGVHRRFYPGLLSIRQPGLIKEIEIGRKRFLITADTGAVKSYTSAQHGFTWTDAVTAGSIANSIDPTLTGLKANVSNVELLGRLQVSNIEGKNSFTQLFQHLEMFGGRGFSIWDSSNCASPVFDSDGTLEEYMEAFDRNVFNTDYVRNLNYQSPEQLRDSVSYLQGAQVTGMDLADENGTYFLIVGTWSTGTLFVYTVDVSSGQPIPQFQSIVRSGQTDIPWRDMYASKSAGDLYISDIGIITSEHSPTDSPLLYVVSTGAGALSLYSIEEQHESIPGPIVN